MSAPRRPAPATTATTPSFARLAWAGRACHPAPVEHATATALAAALAERGLQPFILELPAHGRSAGATSNLPQFARAIEYLGARLQACGLALHATERLAT